MEIIIVPPVNIHIIGSEIFLATPIPSIGHSAYTSLTWFWLHIFFCHFENPMNAITSVEPLIQRPRKLKNIIPGSALTSCL